MEWLRTDILNGLRPSFFALNSIHHFLHLLLTGGESGTMHVPYLEAAPIAPDAKHALVHDWIPLSAPGSRKRASAFSDWRQPLGHRSW